jgi:hypothetical protein
MAAACHADPVAAFERLGDFYCRQRYPHQPTPQLVTQASEKLLADFIGGYEAEITSHPHYRLHILTSRGRRLLQAPRLKLSTSAGFGMAILANLISRAQFAQHFARVVFSDTRDPAFWLKAKFDAFDTHFAPLMPDNLAAALLASSTLPFMMEPVRRIPHAPIGTYWDGGLIDYHLALPYSRVAGDPEGGLVLYPHFDQHIVPGWFDRRLPWRRAGRGANRGWLDNVILVAPARSFLRTLSLSKLPDRSDFLHYGANHDFRILNWKLAISEGERLREAFAAFVENPDLSRVRPI